MKLFLLTSSLVDNRRDFIVNFTVFEGKRYKITKIKYNSSIRNLKESKIEELVDLEVGDWFSSLEIDNSIKKITDRTSQMGYAFVNVSQELRSSATIK